MLVGDFQGLKVYKVPPENKRTFNAEGEPEGLRRFGKIHHPVFAPSGTRVVGFMLRMPDIAGMIKQEDRFAALDALEIYEGGITVTDERASFDYQAAKRLGLDLDRCLIWTGMDVVTESGKRVGYCADAAFSIKTGAVQRFVLSEGGASSALVGNREMPVRYLKGYRDGAMIVSDEALDLEFSGGAAAKAAEASVKVKASVKKGAATLDEHGSRALNKGSRALGKQLGKTKGMFSGFMSEYKKAAGKPAKKGKTK